MTDLVAQFSDVLPRRYNAESILGEGATAFVILAHDVRQSRYVAIKVLKPEIAAGLNADRFRREIDIVAQLTHPNILPVFDSGVSSGHLFYVMPHVAGESLRQLMSRELQVGIDPALRLTCEIASGLAYAHRQGVIHRDIKPENILLAEGHAVIADFGLARAIGRVQESHGTGQGLAVGTAPYMSPEQASDGDHVDGRSDLYALGCVLYEMLAGEPPYTGRSVTSIIARHLTAPIPSLQVVRPSVSGELAKVAERMLAKAPADRYQTADELREVLEDCRVEHRSSERVFPKDSPRSWSRALGIVATLIAALALIVSLVNIDEPTSALALVEPDPTRIAVLYLESPDGDPALNNVGKGITRGLISTLGSVPLLTVISEPGIAGYSSSRPIVDSLVQRHGVGTLIYGFLEPLADSTRLEIHLADATTNTEIDRFVVTKPRVSSIALRDDAIRDVQIRLRSRLGDDIELRNWRAGTTDDRAWEMHQLAVGRHRDAMALPAGEDGWVRVRMLQEADSLFAEASARDRRWNGPVLEQGWLAWDRATLVDVTTDLESHKKWIESGLSHAARAVSIQSETPAALELRGYLTYRLWRAGNHTDTVLASSAESDLLAAVTVEPSLARAWAGLSMLWQRLGRRAEAHRAARRAVEEDAFLRDLPESVNNLIYAHLYAEEPDSASALCAWGSAQFPGDHQMRWCELVVLGWYGQSIEDADRLWELVVTYEDAALVTPPPYGELINRIWPVGRFFAAGVFARAGLRDRADVLRTEVRRRLVAAGYADSWLTNEAVVLAELGRVTDAEALVARALSDNPSLAPEMRRLPLLRPLYGSETFRRLVGIEESGTN